MSEPDISIIIPRRGINDEGKGKKYALNKLISSVHTDYVWLQDDDTDCPKITLQSLSDTLKASDYPDMLILPLRMKEGKGTVLERMQQAEYAAIQQLTVETAKKGRAVMCSGANLVVRRERWMESYADLHPQLPSGDDMFLLESFKRRRLKIAVCEAADATAAIEPCHSFKSLIRQRMRWAGKTPEYTDRDIVKCGLLVLAANMLQLFFPHVLVVKFPLEYLLILKGLKREGRLTKPVRQSLSWLPVCLLLEVAYPFYVIVCLVAGIYYSRRSTASF